MNTCLRCHAEVDPDRALGSQDCTIIGRGGQQL